MMRVAYTHRGAPVELQIERKSDTVRVVLPNDADYELTARKTEDGVIVMSLGDRTIQVPYARTPGALQLSYCGRVYELTPHSAASPDVADHSGELTAPMTGAVSDVLVQAGDSIEAYQPLVIVEAMKVLATVEAPFAGTVDRVHVEKGDQIEQGTLLIEVSRST